MKCSDCSPSHARHSRTLLTTLRQALPLPDPVLQNRSNRKCLELNMTEVTNKRIKNGNGWASGVWTRGKKCERGRHAFLCKSFCTIFYWSCMLLIWWKKGNGRHVSEGRVCNSIPSCNLIMNCWRVAGEDVRLRVFPPSLSLFLNLKWKELQPICLSKVMFQYSSGSQSVVSRQAALASPRKF